MSIDELVSRHWKRPLKPDELATILAEDTSMAPRMAKERDACAAVIRARGRNACAITTRKHDVLTALLAMRGS